MKASVAHGSARVREWAKKKGYEVSDRGRISAWIVNKYDRVHGDVTTGRRIVVPKKSSDFGPVGSVAPSKSTPKCPLHQELMVFHAVKQVWECPKRKAENCRLIHRPVESKEDGKVLLGEGETQLRLLVHRDDSGNPINRVILISDNDVALDITDYIDMTKFLDTYDTDLIISKAQQRGKKVVDIEVVKPVPLRMKLSIHGIS